MTYLPSTGHDRFIPLRWWAPKKIGNIEPLIRFHFSDSTTMDRRNTDTLLKLEETKDAVVFPKDGLRVTKIELMAVNVGAAAETRDLADFLVDGFQA